MVNNENTIKFVRQTLGCACPDEVFEKIEYGHADHGEETCIRTITVGGRLLIYIWKVNDLAMAEAKLPTVLLGGKEHRDGLGLNRIRIVLATDDVERIGPMAQRLFKAWNRKDEKVHLHVLRTEDVALLPVP